MIDTLQGASLFGAAVAAGAINSVAGGGSFLTFPALVLTGMPSIAANATSTVAVWPGTVASVGAYREDIRRERRLLPGLLAVSIIGGLLGAFVLLRTPQPTFDRILPWLLLIATLIFAFGARLARRLGARPAADGSPARIGPAGWLLQLVIATYAGYFGGGAGLLMLAMLSLAGLTDIHAMNGIKTLLGSTANLLAIIAFIWAGKIFWPQALLMAVGSTAGGYAGARFARRVNPAVIRTLVIVVGAAMTAYFFVRR
ncbi:MAG: sulfite exporter TauE/SafE family protein [Opitutales bacterium]